MAKLTQFPKFVATDNDGEPLVGGKLYTYDAGTTTPKATYTDASGVTSNANPVVLDSAGRGDVWLGEGAYKFILKTSADSTLWTVDNISGDVANAFGGEYNVLSTNTTITTAYANSVNECTATLTLTLAAVADAGEGFYFVVKNTSASNTVTIEPDTGDLIDGAATLELTAGSSCLVVCSGTKWTTVFLSFKNGVTAASTIADNRLVRGDGGSRGVQQSGITVDDSDNVTGVVGLTVTGAINFAAAVSLASATTTDLGAQTSNFVTVTGTTTITSFGTASAGVLRYVRFSGALTLTYNATSLILPTSASITTAAGDVALFVSEGSGNWRCLSYEKISGLPLKTVNSYVRVATCAGRGSTNTYIRRFSTTIGSAGSDITYADTAADGASFTINTTGIYALAYSDTFDGGADFGISLNSSQLTTSISSITAADRLVVSTASNTNNRGFCGVTLRFASGDIIRPHLAGTYGNGASPNDATFTVTRIV